MRYRGRGSGKTLHIDREVPFEKKSKNQTTLLGCMRVGSLQFD